MIQMTLKICSNIIYNSLEYFFLVIFRNSDLNHKYAKSDTGTDRCGGRVVDFGNVILDFGQIMHRSILTDFGFPPPWGDSWVII